MCVQAGTSVFVCGCVHVCGTRDLCVCVGVHVCEGKGLCISVSVRRKQGLVYLYGCAYVWD